MSLPIQLLSTDFDGTLHADFEDPPVPPDLETLIGGLQRQGMIWVINTGRDLSSVMEGLARARLSIHPDFLVVVERNIYRREGSHYVGLETWNQQCQSDHDNLFDLIKSDMPKLVEWIDARFQATLYEDDFSPFCLIAENSASADAIHDYLEDYARAIPQLSVVRNDIYARFSHQLYNKGTALAEIARQLDLPPRAIAAAGDHFNDLPMLQQSIAQFLIAPHNAIDDVKQSVQDQGGYVSHQPWGHGVARGLEHFLESHPPSRVF